MSSINWSRPLPKILVIIILVIIVVLIIYYLASFRISKFQKQVSPTSTVYGFPSGFTVEELKKIKVPEKGEKAEKGIAVPLEVVQSASEASSKIRIFELKGEGGKLSPQSFIAYQNDILNIKITALDNDYDFRLEGYNLETKAKKGGTKTIEFQALNIGKYNFYCSLCRTKENPAGSIIIVPK